MCFCFLKRCFCPDPIPVESTRSSIRRSRRPTPRPRPIPDDDHGDDDKGLVENKPSKKIVKPLAPPIPTAVTNEPVLEQPTRGVTELKHTNDAYDDSVNESQKESCIGIETRIESVPNKYVQVGEQIPVLDNLENHPWYFGAISFYEARSFMEGSKTGTYLVYERPYDPKIPYALLLRFNNEIKNYPIYEEDSRYLIATGYYKDTLEDLIKAYEQDEGITLGLCTALVEPCAKLDRINDLSDDFKDRFEINRDDIKIDKALGKGFSSEVFKGKWKNKDIAVKSLSGSFSKEDFEREVLMLKRLKHKNIVQFYGISTQDVPYYIILEYMKFGDLTTYLKKQDLVEYQRIHVASQVAEGMQYLAKEGVVHRDLAARNVLLQEKLTAKISDFGISRLTNNDDVYDATTERKLPIRWLAPECAYNKQFSEQSDVWAFSILLMEIYTRRMPYKEFKGNTEEFLDEIKRGYRMKQPDNMPDDIFKLCTECWISIPNIRPKFKEIANFFKEYNKLEHNSFNFIEAF